VQFGTGGVPNTDAEFIAWMRKEAVDDAGNGRSVPRASWNYYGNNSCGFLDCKIVSADLGNGLVTSAAGDPSIGGDVILGSDPEKQQTGIMVDLNPEGTWGTQIFADLFQVVSGTVRLQVPRPLLCHDGCTTGVTWLHHAALQVPAATWQSSIPRARSH